MYELITLAPLLWGISFIIGVVFGLYLIGASRVKNSIITLIIVASFGILLLFLCYSVTNNEVKSVCELFTPKGMVYESDSLCQYHSETSDRICKFNLLKTISSSESRKLAPKILCSVEVE